MRSWLARFLNETRSFLQGNLDLRDPQVEGWFRTRQPRFSPGYGARRVGVAHLLEDKLT